MNKSLLTLAFGLSFLAPPAHAQIQRYVKGETRKQLLEISASLKPQKLELKNGLPTDPVKRDFVKLYRDEIHPVLEKLRVLDSQATLLHLLIDAGAENSPEEKAAWDKEYLRMASEFNEYRVAPRWLELVARWGKLAESLNGELPEFARKFAKAMDMLQFQPELKSQLDVIEQKSLEYQNAVKATKAGAALTSWGEAYSKIIRDYKNQLITFQDAQQKLNSVIPTGGHSHIGAEAVGTHGHLLNEIAIIRSQMAKAKGKSTWAEYAIDISGQGYSKRFQGVASQRKFLEEWLKLTQPVRRDWYSRRVQQMKVDETSMRGGHLSLLTPPDLSLALPYFPPDQITNVMEKALVQSGFDPKTLSQVIADDLPRQGKNPSNAYMSPALLPSAEVIELDGDSLNLENKSGSRPVLIYISQNFRNGGLGELQTDLHEFAGHALDYLNRGDKFYSPAPSFGAADHAYGYVETPSMSAEYFLEDPQFLHDNAVPVNGEKPSVETFKQWLKNDLVGQALSVSSYASSALYDIDIWDYDYSAPGALTYLERVKLVDDKINQLSEIYPRIDSPVPPHYFWVSTVHFVSGQVRNIGYSFAMLSAHMIAKHYSKRLQELTGRASWYQQPLLASIMVNDFYKEGWKMSYPENIEKITGREYDMAAILQELTEPLRCEDSLTSKAL